MQNEVEPWNENITETSSSLIDEDSDILFYSIFNKENANKEIQDNLFREKVNILTTLLSVLTKPHLS